MKDYEYVNFEKLTVVDYYATYSYEGTSFSDDWYFLVSFEDVDGNTYYASMTVEEGKDDKFDELREYIENDNAFIGDCVINAVVEYVVPIEESLLDVNLERYYHDAVSDCGDGDIIDSGIGFEYSCAPENFESYCEHDALVYKIALYIGLGLVILGIVLAVLGFKTSIEKVKQQEEDVLLNYGQGNNQYAGVYYTPPTNNNNFND